MYDYGFLVIGTVTALPGAGELSVTRTDVDPETEATVTAVMTSVAGSSEGSASTADASDAFGAAAIAYGGVPPLMATRTVSP